MNRALEQEWSEDPTQPGRIAVGDAITVDVRVAFWRVPGGDAEASQLHGDATALVLAAKDMAKALQAMLDAFPAATATTEEHEARVSAGAALRKAKVMP